MPTPPVAPQFPPTHGRGLLVISPGVGSQHAETLYRAACSLASSGVRRLLLREPSLTAAQVETLARRLLYSYPQDGLLLHEKCAGARTVAASLGLGLHLSGSADWEAERRRTSCLLGASAHTAAEVERAAAIGLQWAFLSPVFQPASKPLDTRPHLGEAAVVEAQRASPTLVVHALGGISPTSASRLSASGVGGICVLGGVWTMRPDGSAEADTEAAVRYLDAIDRAVRLRGGWRRGARTRRLVACQSTHANGGRADAAGRVGGVVGNVHGGRCHFDPGGAASAVGGEFSSMLTAGGRGVGGGSRLPDPSWRRLNPNLAGEETVPEPEPRWRQVLRPDLARLAGRLGFKPDPSPPVERGDTAVAVVRVSNSCRTWEPFIAAVVDGTGARIGPDVRAEPAGGTLAPRGGANNACDETKPYPDWVKVSVVVHARPEAGGGESPFVLVAGAVTGAGGRGDQDAPGGLFLVVKTEEEQWTYALEAETATRNPDL